MHFYPGDHLSLTLKLEIDFEEESWLDSEDIELARCSIIRVLKDLAKKPSDL